jgi:hypothetical protein
MTKDLRLRSRKGSILRWKVDEPAAFAELQAEEKPVYKELKGSDSPVLSDEYPKAQTEDFI